MHGECNKEYMHGECNKEYMHGECNTIFGNLQLQTSAQSVKLLRQSCNITRSSVSEKTVVNLVASANMFTVILVG